MFTYAFAFYLSQQSNQTHLFEQIQADLENSTEWLSGVSSSVVLSSTQMLFFSFWSAISSKRPTHER